MERPPAVTFHVRERIHRIRGQRVVLDHDLAAIYGVTTSRLNEQVKRNIVRFPSDFMFRLTTEEYARLRSQNAILDNGRGKHRKYPPRAFTEHGAVMAASVLSSRRAVEMSILVVRAFVQLRELMSAHQWLSKQLRDLERAVASHDRHIHILFEALEQLMAEPAPSQRRIGFEVEDS